MSESDRKFIMVSLIVFSIGTIAWFVYDIIAYDNVAFTTQYQTLDGSTIRPANYNGSNSLKVLYYWDYKNRNYSNVMHALNRLQKKYKDKGLVVMPVNFGGKRSIVKETMACYESNQMLALLAGNQDPPKRDMPYAVIFNGSRGKVYGGTSKKTIAGIEEAIHAYYENSE